MKEISEREFQDLLFLRIERYRNYIYGLVKLSEVQWREDKVEYATISRYRNGPFSLTKIGDINEKIPMEQNLLEFVNDHALIHIKPSKYVWRWRD